MSDDVAKDYLSRFEDVKSLYSDQLQVMADVETVYMANYATPEELSEKEIELVGLGKMEAVLRRYMQLVAIRSEKKYHVPARPDTDKGHRQADLLEQVVKAYALLHSDVFQVDVLRDSAFLALLFGRSGLQTIYAPNDERLKVQQIVIDPREYFPLYGFGRRIEAYAIEKWVSAWQMKVWLETLGEKDELDQMPAWVEDEKLLEGADGYNAANDTIRLVEWWDEERYVRLVGGEFVKEKEHQFGGITLTEVMHGRTPLGGAYACRSLFAPVINEFKGLASLRSKQATSVQTMLWPRPTIETPGGTVITPQFDQAGLLEPVEIAPGTRIDWIKPEPNYQVLNQLDAGLLKDISDATLPQVAFNQDIPGDASGFLYKTVLGQIQDGIADIRDELEKGFGFSYGVVLKMLETFAPDDGWEFDLEARAGSRKTVTRVKAEDIAGLHHVKVTVTPTLPESRSQKIAQLAQTMGMIDPGTGQPFFPLKAALKMTETEDLVGDWADFERDRNWQSLLQNDPKLKQLWFDRIKADYTDEIIEWTKIAEKGNDRLEDRENAVRRRAIERGLDNGVYFPAEIAANPQAIQQYLGYLQQGQTPQVALQMIMNPSPMQPQADSNAPDAQGQNAHNLAAQLIPQLYGGETPMNGATGYETGTDTNVMPPAMLGAQPRQSVDAGNLEMEQLQEDMRRNGMPPTSR